MDDRLRKQRDFLLVIDKEKEIYRQTHILGGFRRENDAFAALTDGQTPSGKNNSGKEKSKDGQVTSTGKEDDIPTKVRSHSHLMDSYSRTGEYCQLNDNLTYGKNRSGRKEQWTRTRQN